MVFTEWKGVKDRLEIFLPHIQRFFDSINLKAKVNKNKVTILPSRRAAVQNTTMTCRYVSSLLTLILMIQSSCVHNIRYNGPNLYKCIQGVNKVRRHCLSGHYLFITELITLKFSQETNNLFSVRIWKWRNSLGANFFTRRLNASPVATAKIKVQGTSH